MKLDEFIHRMPVYYYASNEDGGPSYILESSPGRGKSTAIKMFPKIMKRIDPAANYGVVIINGASFTMMHALGFMIWETLPNGRTISKFTDPAWMFTQEGKHISEYDGGIIFFDEADKMGTDEKKLGAEAMLSKMIGSHKLPPGWVVMLAANRMGDRAGSTKEFDHNINRRIRIDLTDDLEAWIAWAEGEASMLPEVITFGKENPQLLFEPKPDDQRPWGTPRSLHQASIHLRSLMLSFDSDKIPTDPLTMEEVKGGIGAPATAQLFKTIRLGQELHTYEEVVAHPKITPLPTKPDAMRLMTYKLAARISPSDAARVLSYVERMPMEHQAMMIRTAIQRNYQLAFEPNVSKWCARNTELIAILNRYKVSDKG